MKEVTLYQKNLYKDYMEKRDIYFGHAKAMWELFLPDLHKFIDTYGAMSTHAWVAIHIPTTYERQFGMLAMRNKHKENPRVEVDIPHTPSKEQLDAIKISEDARNEYIALEREITTSYQPYIIEAENELGKDGAIDWLYKNMPDIAGRVMAISKLMGL